MFYCFGPNDTSNHHRIRSIYRVIQKSRTTGHNFSSNYDIDLRFVASFLISRGKLFEVLPTSSPPQGEGGRGATQKFQMATPIMWYIVRKSMKKENFWRKPEVDLTPLSKVRGVQRLFRGSVPSFFRVASAALGHTVSLFKESSNTPSLIPKSSYCPRATTAPPVGGDGPVTMKHCIKMRKVTEELQT